MTNDQNMLINIKYQLKEQIFLHQQRITSIR